MAFGAVIILLLFYFVRPQDWMPGMAGLNIVKPVVALGILGLVSRPAWENRWKLLKTPQEWALLIFAGYVVINAPSPLDTATDLVSLVTFSFLVLHTINTEERLLKFMRWWLISLVIVMCMALATLAGWDITNARGLLDEMRGRFCLNTWIFNNPNAFGHSMITVLPLSYFLLFYRATMGSRLLASLLMAGAVWMIIPTESKGSFLAGFIGLMTVLVFGRPLWVQVVSIVLAAALGSSALAVLPRMQGMNNLRADEGVQGRLLAWEAARTAALTHSTGVGYKQFQAVITWNGVQEPKATHSAYIQIGADLGVPGLCIYLGMLVLCLRSLMRFPGATDDLERCRRMLFALVLTFIISGWMIDRAYHTELFLMIGAVAAYHQLHVKARLEPAEEADEDDAEEEEEEPVHVFAPVRQAAPTLALAMAGGGSVALAGGASELAYDEEEEWSDAEVKVPSGWTRPTILDALLGFAAGQGVMWFWEYVLKNL